MSGNIVIGYLPSAVNDAALREAGELASTWNCRLVVVNASRGDSPYDPVLATEEDLDKITSTLQGMGVEHLIEPPVQGHHPADAVLDAAEKHAARLIVIGLRSRSRVGKALFGSTAQRVLLQANCSVLAVKLPEEH